MSGNAIKSVSIIITTCRRDMAVLERAVKSAEAQTYENKEIIVINDFPGYASQIEAMLKNHNSVRTVNNTGEHGVSYARDLGVKEASGEFMEFLDDDDEWLPDKTMFEVMAMDEDIALSYCDYEVNMEGRVIKADPKKIFHEGNVFKAMLTDNFIGGASIPMIRTSVIRDMGGFDKELSFGEDYDMWLRIARGHNIKCVKMKLVKYNVGHESLTGSFDRRMEGWNHMLDKYRNDYAENPEAFSVFSGTMVREAAKHTSLKTAWKLAVKYGKMYDMMSGMAQRILGVY